MSADDGSSVDPTETEVTDFNGNERGWEFPEVGAILMQIDGN